MVSMSNLRLVKLLFSLSEPEGGMKTVSVKKVTDFYCPNLQLYKIFKNK